MTRVAAIDCGTNSIRLLIADLDPAGGPLSDVVRQMEVVRLGEGVDRTGLLSVAAIERTRVALAGYARQIEQHAAVRVRMVATSASRDAGNRDDFVRMVHATLGADPEVITGNEEAALSFAGAIAGLPGIADPVLLTDIGGGSTELVLGRMAAGPGGSVQAAHSMDVGCVRLTERHLHDDPASTAQIDAALADLHAAIDAAALDVPLGGAASFVGVAGTVTTIAALALHLPAYDPGAIHGSVISAQQVADITTMLMGMTRAQRAGLAVMHPGRVDVIVGGALVLRTLMERTGSAQVIASEHDILDGIAASLAQAIPPA
jgi:exopolyphosphatase/guanosine-5'-triphosphate,3'-diphosphate pyrophosphatase